MFPIVFGGRWFVKAYILLMLLFPFVNRVLTTINRKTYQALLAVQLFLFSVWPSFLPNPPLDDYGYSFVHLITIYMIGGYLRLHVKKYPPKWLCFLGYVVSFGIVLLSKLLNQGYEWAYNYPFVMAEAICLFMLFSQVALQSDLLNLVASSAFGVYLIHTNVFFGPLGYEKLFHGSSLNKGSILLMILAIPICAVFFYLSGFVLESLKSLVFRYSVDSVLDRIKILNTPIMVEGEEKE